MPLVGQAVLDGAITRAHAAVLPRLVGQIEDDRLVEAQQSLIRAATLMEPVQLGVHRPGRRPPVLLDRPRPSPRPSVSGRCRR